MDNGILQTNIRQLLGKLIIYSKARIGQIKLFHNFLDMFVRISKTLKCTIPLES
jgi:hypothetical protein